MRFSLWGRWRAKLKKCVSSLSSFLEFVCHLLLWPFGAFFCFCAWCFLVWAFTAFFLWLRMFLERKLLSYYAAKTNSGERGNWHTRLCRIPPELGTLAGQSKCTCCTNRCQNGLSHQCSGPCRICSLPNTAKLKMKLRKRLFRPHKAKTPSLWEKPHDSKGVSLKQYIDTNLMLTSVYDICPAGFWYVFRRTRPQPFACFSPFFPFLHNTNVSARILIQQNP